MKAKIYAILIILALIPVATAAAVEPVVTIPNPLNVESFQELLDAIINFIFWVGMAIAPVLFVIAGFIYVTSAGSSRIDTAKKMMLYTVIGLVILLFARGLVTVLKSIIGAQ